MARVETSVSSSVVSVARDIVLTDEYSYYYLWGETSSAAYLVQSKGFQDGVFSDCMVSEFHFVFDEDDRIPDWRISTYHVDLYYPPDNSESYVVYTNAFAGYPVLKGDVRYYSSYFFAGACALSICFMSAILFFRLWRINHG